MERGNGAKVAERHEGVECVHVVNGRERVRVETSRSRQVRLEGTIGDRRFGTSLSSDGKSLYAICFDGLLQVPSGVEVRLKQGVSDVARELFETFAPALPYHSAQEGAATIRETLGKSKPSPTDIVACLQKVHGTTGLPMLSPQHMLLSPAVLEGLNKDVLLRRYDAAHSVSSMLAASAKPGPRTPAATVLPTLDERVQRIVYDTSIRSGLPGPQQVPLTKSALQLAHHPDYRELRLGRNLILATGRWVESRIGEGVKLNERLADTMVASLDVLEHARPGFSHALLSVVGASAGPVSGLVLVDHLRQAVRASRAPTQGKKDDVGRAAAGLGLAAASTRQVEDWNNARRSEKVGSVLMYTIAQASLDQRYPQAPDRPITPAEHRRVVERADLGAREARADLENMRTENFKKQIILAQALRDNSDHPAETQMAGASGNVTQSFPVAIDMAKVKKFASEHQEGIVTGVITFFVTVLLISKYCSMDP